MKIPKWARWLLFAAVSTVLIGFVANFVADKTESVSTPWGAIAASVWVGIIAVVYCFTTPIPLPVAEDVAVQDAVSLTGWTTFLDDTELPAGACWILNADNKFELTFFEPTDPPSDLHND